MLNAKLIGSSMMALGFSLVCLTAHAADMSISGTPASTVTVGERYHFLPTVKGADVAHLTFNYQNLPTFSKHYRSSGLIMGTPTEPGVYKNVQIGAWDGKHYVLMAPFTITVKAKTGSSTTASNSGSNSSSNGSSGHSTVTIGTPTSTGSAGNTGSSSSTSSTSGSHSGTVSATPVVSLTLSGAPSLDATVGKIYSFTPTVLSSGGKLSYSIANKPAWASFNTATGALTGAPAANSPAVAANVTISVSNGAKTSSLAFTIDVAPALTGIANISWSKPSTNTDGSTLTNLSGYVVRYGTSASALNQQIKVAANATTAQIENLTAGHWYFQVAAVSANNVVSQFSSVATDTIS